MARFIVVAFFLIARRWIRPHTNSFHHRVGVRCLSLAGPIVAQLKGFFSSDYMRDTSLFYHSMLTGLDCFSEIKSKIWRQ